MAAKKKHFIEKMGLKNGALHADLGVPTDQKIPHDKLMAAANSSDKKVAKRANTAMMLEGLSHKKKKSSGSMKSRMYK